MATDSKKPLPREITARLDGLTVELPPERRSFAAIRSYLESIALQRQRILCALFVDGEPANLTQPAAGPDFSCVEAETMSLNEVPVQLIKAALQQTASARQQVESAVALVLINEICPARELWWNLVGTLKEPLLTLSLLPENICGPSNGRASLTQLRKWQLQQLGCVIHDVDEICQTQDATALAEALEKRVLTWLDNLQKSLELWLETVLSAQPACQQAQA